MVDQAVYGCTCPPPTDDGGEWKHEWREGCPIHGAHVPAQSRDQAVNASARVLEELAQERWRQDKKWGEQNHPDGTGPQGFHVHVAGVADRYRTECQAAAQAGVVTYRHIFLEEVWEAMAEQDPAKLRTELVQAAAVAVAWVEAIDRRKP